MSIKKSILSLLFTYCTVETSKKSIQLPWKNYMLRLAIDNKNLPPSIFGLDTMKYRRRITCRVSLWIKNCSSHFFWFGISEQNITLSWQLNDQKIIPPTLFGLETAKKKKKLLWLTIDLKKHASPFIWFGNSEKKESKNFLWLTIDKKNRSSQFTGFGNSEIQKNNFSLLTIDQKNYSSHFIWFGNSHIKKCHGCLSIKKSFLPLNLFQKKRIKANKKLVADYRPKKSSPTFSISLLCEILPACSINYLPVKCSSLIKTGRSREGRAHCYKYYSDKIIKFYCIIMALRKFK